MGSGKVISALVAGAAVGALIGVLFAPEKGEDLRNKIADMKSDCLNTLKDKVNEFTGKNAPQQAGTSNQAV